MKLALNALEKNPACASLFGSSSASYPVAPGAELLLLSGAGDIQIGDIPQQPGSPYVTSATTVGVEPYSYNIGNGASSVLLYESVTITINDLAGSFVTGTTQDQAITLIHELGHAFSDLFGPSSTKITSDANNPTASQANTALVTQACFPGGN